MPEARQLGAGTDRAGDVARLSIGGELVGDLPGEAAGGDVQLVRLVGDVVLVEHGREAAETRRLDGVDADIEERRVHPADDVGTGETEELVATLQRFTAEVVGGEVEALDVRAEGAVEDDDPFGNGIEVGLASHCRSTLPAGPDRPEGHCLVGVFRCREYLAPTRQAGDTPMWDRRVLAPD